ncbi:MAG: 23S rRNA (adenine(2503)-C(2))-methyltransferase RlmN [Bacteroidetes bacterium]|nr:23S rRNA (adenine(2503)-C(2))-methyltransferase RlmN [Bacteroidota bacterium]
MNKKNLKGLDLTELQKFVEELGEKKYRALQLYIWIYSKSAQKFSEMTDISKEFRSVLASSAAINNLELVTESVSTDGTIKFLFGLEDNLAIESVLIPSIKNKDGKDKRLTLCISTQVGCPLDCKFCATGAMGFIRNLTSGEIVDQVIQVQRTTPKRITNIVYMGMGEPFLNYDNVMKSIDIINDDRGLNIGSRHITISTAGYADKIRQMADEGRTVKLALSLHSLDNEKRIKLMPITKKYPVEMLIDSLEYYYQKKHSRPTFEYIMFDGFNDTPADIKAFLKLSRRIPCKVNLIPFHSISFMSPNGIGASLRPSPTQKIETFAGALREAGITVMVRRSSGQDIQAACGQLAVIESKKLRNKI